MTTYNGHRSRSYWNVSLWINNDEGLYNLALDCIRNTKSRKEAAQSFMQTMIECGKPGIAPETPDGAKYSVDKIMSAMRDMEG